MIKLPTEKTPVLCQGITTEKGAIHVERALAYGTSIVAGTSKDTSVRNYAGIPVFRTVREAVRKTNPAVSVVFSTPARALADVEEAIRAKIPLIVCTTEHVPLHDVLKMIVSARRQGVTLIGPSSPGIVRVGEALAGSIPAHLFPKGDVAVVGRSSSLIYEAVQQLSEEGLGVSTCISLGAAPLVGTSFGDVLEPLMKDKNTKALLMIGQLTGDFEQELANLYRQVRRKKPMAVYIPGQTWEGRLYVPLLGVETARPEKIIAEKKKALIKAGAVWIESVAELGKTVARIRDGKSSK